MATPDADATFLRDLIKGSRQRPTHVGWADRDGTPRMTALTSPESVRLNQIAHRLGVSPSEVLRLAAYVPVVKPGPSRAEGAESGSAKPA